MAVIVSAVLAGMVALLAGTLPRNLLFAANLRVLPEVPWAVPTIGVYLALFWWYLRGGGPPEETGAWRRECLRANRLPARVWCWALIAGGLGLVALVLGLRILNRLVALPEQRMPETPGVPRGTMLALLLMGALVAGMVEEGSFRGYMQGPIERRHGIGVAILVTGTMFALAHLDFTPVLWPYYVAVAAIYGMVARLTGSVLPAVVLHTGGNIYSNLDLWLHGRAEWQTGAAGASLIRDTGLDRPFGLGLVSFLGATVVMLGAYRVLARVARETKGRTAGASARPLVT